MPRWKPWYGIAKLAARYGEIFYLEVLGQPIVVLSKPELLLEFLEKRAANSSDRTQSPLIKLAGQGSNFGLMPYGRRWRQHRREFWQQFRPEAIRHYQPVQLAVTRKFLGKLLDRPNNYRELVRYTFSAAVIKLTYDFDPEDENDELVRLIDSAFEGLRKLTVPAQMLVETLPFVKNLPQWLPGMGFYRMLANSRIPSERIVHTSFNEAKARLVGGEEETCMVSRMLARITKASNAPYEESELTAKGVAFLIRLASGGADTVLSTVEGLLLALTLYPEVQRKAQAELDAIVGRHRLPEFEDRDNLVYINAIVKEALRWHNVFPLGVSHRTVNDDELQGYFIPAGTTVIPNVWGCMHDSEVYSNPEKFFPERFIRDGKMDTAVLDPTAFIFGFGRRICPGRQFADAELFITVASLLHVFTVNPLPFNEGPTKLEATHGFLSYV
ncbi:cytochrome P450 [Trametes meyenii]|nr:cytochrome P450 [Trametes meyenii]